MKQIALATYSIEIREKRQESHSLLGKVDGKTTCYDFISKVFKMLKKTDGLDDVGEKIVLKPQIVEEKKPLIYGIIDSGDYGYSAFGHNIKTKKKSYDRTIEDAELIPFYFQFYIPERKSKGLLIIQRFGNDSIYTSLRNLLEEEFRKQFPEHVLIIQRIVPNELLIQLLQGSMTGIQVTYKTFPKDIADRFNYLDGNIAEQGEIRVSVRAKKNCTLGTPKWLKEVRKAPKQASQLLAKEFEDNSELQIEMHFGGRRRKINLRNPESIAPYVIPADDIDKTSNGHPVYASIHSYCNELREKLLGELKQDEEDA